MKAIILAAGKGSRISKEIGNIPKSTLKIGETSILRRTVMLLKEFNIDVTICVGYKQNLIRKDLEDLKVSYIYNPFYESMNNMGTLWFTQEIISNDDILIMSADIIFESGLIEKMTDHKPGFILAIDKSRVKDGDYFLSLDSDGKVINYGSDLNMEDRDCEYVGFAIISKEVSFKFKKELISQVSRGFYNDYFEKIIFSFIGKGEGVSTIDISGIRWREIDQYNDYKIAINEFG